MSKKRFELFWSEFSSIRTEYEEILSISSYSFRMRENADKNNSEYGQFLHSVVQPKKLWLSPVVIAL